MAAKTEFETILNEILDRGGSSQQQNFQREQTTGAKANPSFDFYFNLGNIKATIFNVNVKSGYKAKPQEQKVEQMKVELKVEPPPQPPPRVKRKTTFDQERALKFFVKLGEAQINEYSTDQEIKSAYKRLALKYHPDRNKSSENIFKELSAAYRKFKII